MKNETKGIAPLIIAIVIIVVAAGVGVGAYVATRGGGGGGGGGGGDIAGATNLSFDMTNTSPAMALAFKAKDIGSSSMKLRMEGTYLSQDFGCILNGAQQKLWVEYGGTWTDMSSYYSTYWSTWSSIFSGYQTNLGSWTGSGSITVGTTTISNISTATLDDSLFQA